MATICRRCNTPFPKKPNGNTYGFDHFAALRKGKPKSGKANTGNTGRTNGGNRQPANQRNSGISELQQLTTLVKSLASNVQSLQATQTNGNHHPSENAPLGGGGRAAGANGAGWGKGARGRHTGESQGDQPLTRPSTPISPEIVSPDFGGELDSTVGREPSQLAAPLAASYNIPPSVAANLASQIHQHQTPISPPPQKYTAIFQSFSNAHNAANAAVLKARASLDMANVAYKAAMVAAEEALASARNASEELKAAKLRAQATWDELQANSQNAKTAQPASDSNHERIKAARKRLEGINHPELDQIVGNLKEVEAHEAPDDSMPGAGVAVEPSSVEGQSSTDQNVQDDLCPYGTDYAARATPTVSPISPNIHTSSEYKRSHEGSSGDELRFTPARLGAASLQSHRLEQSKLENTTSALQITDGVAGEPVSKAAETAPGRTRSRSPSARKGEEPKRDS